MDDAHVLPRGAYQFWDTAPRVDGDNAEMRAVLRRAERGGRGDHATLGQLAVVPAAPLDQQHHLHVPVDEYVWARGVVRGAKEHYTQPCVVVSTLVQHTAALHRELVRAWGRPVAVVALDAPAGVAAAAQGKEHTTQGNVVVNGVHVLGRGAYSDDPRRALQQRAALIEIADVYIAYMGVGLDKAVRLHTPALMLLPTNTLIGSRTHVGGHWLGTSLRSVRVDHVHVNARGVPPRVVAEEAVRVTGHERADVVFHSYLDPTMGYGSSAVNMATAMERFGLTIRYHAMSSPPPPKNWRTHVTPATIAQLSRAQPSDLYLGYFVPHEGDVRDVHVLARKAKYSIVYTTFETTLPPRRWPSYINRYDKLLVSCPEIARSFHRRGVSVPIEVVPLGVSVADWPLLHRRRSSPFRFLLVADGGWTNHRKNYQFVFDAFVEAFGNDPTVELILKLTRVDDALRAIEPTLPPNIRIFKGRLPQPKLLRLMKDADVFVFPSHGEGYGLPPREAMSTGIPVIIAGFAGLEPIANRTINYCMDYKLVPARGYEAWIPENDGSTDWGKWASIEISELERMMKHARENAEETRERGALAAAWIREHDTYAHTGLHLIDAFGSMLYGRKQRTLDEVIADVS